MGTASFETGVVVRINGDKYRLVRMVGADEWQLEQEKTLRIDTISVQILQKHLAEGRLSFVSRGDVTHCGRAISIPDSDELEKAKVKLLYVKEVLGLPNSLPLIANVSHDLWKKISVPTTVPSASSVYAWKSAYLKAGSDVRALVDRHRAKGNRAPRYAKEVIACCEAAIESVFLRRERTSIAATVEDAKIRVAQANRLRPKALELPMPTRRLVERLVRSIPAFDRYASRHGADEARRAYRSVKGHITTTRPLERAEMDHTRLDLMVVDERTGQSLGRPYVTACIDDYTRCILGLYVGFEPPSYKTVSWCLKECFLPKHASTSVFSGIKNAWPACGVMDLLSVDNGAEFHAPLEPLALALGIEIQYSPRKEPWGKGKIERFFGTLNHEVAHGIPGTTRNSVAAKGDYKPEKNAVLTLTEVKTIIYKWIADIYHQRPHRSLGVSPAALWESSIGPAGPRFPDETIHLDAVIGTAVQRTLSHKGIEYAGLLYNSPELNDLRRMHGSKATVNIRIDESDIGSVYVLLPGTHEPVEVPALDAEYACGLSLWLHDVIRKSARRNPDANHGGDLLGSKQEINDIVESARNRRKALGSRGARYLESKERTAPTVPVERGSSVASLRKQNVNHSSRTKEAIIEEVRSEATTAPARTASRFSAIYRK